MIKKVLFRDGKKYYWEENDLHTDAGVIKEKDLKSSKGNVKTHTGNAFLILEANFTDRLEKIKRGPAVMIKKDIGSIIANTGIDKNSLVVDSGTGCGVTAAILARLVKKVVTYERKKDFYKIAEKNFKILGIKNVEQRLADIYEGIKEKNVDLITLDLPEPWKAIEHANKALKPGKYLVSYLPTIIQVSELISKKQGFFHEKTMEILEREWHVEGQRVRPKNQMLGHTGFLVFLRKA